MTRELIRYLTISPDERSWLHEALILSLKARMLTFFVPFKKYVELLSVKTGCLHNEQECEKNAKNVAIAVKRIARKVPWRCKCLEQAIIAKLMMNRRQCSSTLVLGVNKTDSNLIAHAWVYSDSIVITGAKGKDSFIPIFQIT